METARIGTSNVRLFFAALAPPVAVALLLLVSVLLFEARGPLAALMLNVFLLFEMAGFSQAIDLPMPARYFDPHRFERRWVYERLGVRAFKRLMRSALYRRINSGFKLSGGRRGIADLGQCMNSAETAHALLFLVVTALASAALVMGWMDAAAWLMLFNVPLNAYPVMLQRYNRLRVQRLVQPRAPGFKR